MYSRKDYVGKVLDISDSIGLLSGLIEVLPKATERRVRMLKNKTHIHAQRLKPTEECMYMHKTWWE